MRNQRKSSTLVFSAGWATSNSVVASFPHWKIRMWRFHIGRFARRKIPFRNHWKSFKIDFENFLSCFVNHSIWQASSQHLQPLTRSAVWLINDYERAYIEIIRIQYIRRDHEWLELFAWFSIWLPIGVVPKRRMRVADWPPSSRIAVRLSGPVGVGAGAEGDWAWTLGVVTKTDAVKS